jgi:hypothetical protein
MPDTVSAALLDLRLAVRAAIERGCDWADELDSDPILLEVDELGITFDLAGATYGVLRRGQDLRDDRFWRERRREGGLIEAGLFDIGGHVLWWWFGRDVSASERRTIVHCICARPVAGDARWN